MPRFKREIIFDPAYDERNAESGKNYGIHGVNLRFYLTGPKGAVQFVLHTNWHLPHVEKELDSRLDIKWPHLYCHPLPVDLGYHSPKRRYKGQTLLTKDCPLLKGKCYYDGSSLNAEPVYKRLLQEGSDGVWKELEKYYLGIFPGS